MQNTITQNRKEDNQSMPSEKGTNYSWKNWFRSLGPGIIIAALVFGPSKIVITTMMGAGYNYLLLWVVAVAIFFMIIFTNMSARIGLATQKSLLTTIREKWGPWAGIAVGIGIFLVTASFQAGNSIGIGLALSEPTRLSQTFWIIVFNLITISLLFFRSFYKILEKIMIALVFLMLFAFITTLILSRPNLMDLMSGFTFTIPGGSMGLIIAYVASCFSIVGACYQSYLVQERRRLKPDVKQSGKESLVGICLLGLMSAVLLICAAAVLYPKGVTIHSATDMAKALEPAFGKYASYIFLAGLFGASFSSLIGNATLGGTLSGDALGYGGNLSSGRLRFLIALIMCIGGAVAILFGELPLQMIVLAQAITIFIVPFIGIAIFLIANDKEIMGAYRNKGLSKIAGGLGLLILIFLALNNVYVLFIK